MIGLLTSRLPRSRSLIRLILYVTIVAVTNCKLAMYASSELPLKPSAPGVAKVPAKTPKTPRELFNAGTENLRAKQLREAENYLESVLASQSPQFECPALFNLGHVRFGQGVEALKKTPPGSATIENAGSAAQGGAEAIRSVDEAMATDDVQRLVAAYMNGRGRQRQMKAATEAVKQALQQHAVALNKWERASSDFKSALELDPQDQDARENAEVVDRHIAKLVDMIQRMQKMLEMLGQQSKALGEKLKKLKGKIPGKDMPPGAGGEDEEGEFPFGKEPGQKEGATKDGTEVNMSPEQAGWLLESFKLDSERKLPMGPGKPGQPKDRTRPTW
jgi:tetratricopeptide (TPR) repeat protein